jgi:hypothetical protein
MKQKRIYGGWKYGVRREKARTTQPVSQMVSQPLSALQIAVSVEQAAALTADLAARDAAAVEAVNPVVPSDEEMARMLAEDEGTAEQPAALPDPLLPQPVEEAQSSESSAVVEAPVEQAPKVTLRRKD